MHGFQAGLPGQHHLQATGHFEQPEHELHDDLSYDTSFYTEIWQFALLQMCPIGSFVVALSQSTQHLKKLILMEQMIPGYC